MAEVGPFNGMFTVADTAFTLPAWDSDKKVFVSTSSSATTFTVPVGLPKGFACSFVQYGTGALTIAAGSGVTINTGSSLVAAGQYSRLSVQSVGQDLYVLNQST